MRILVYSHWFSPSIGGVETVSRILAEEFTLAGSIVTVVTNTPGPSLNVNYEIIRRPSQGVLRSVARGCDVLLQNTISLRTLIPLALSRNPIIVAHHSWLRRSNGKRGIENYAKLLALRGCTNVSISKSIAESLPVKSTVIGDPFECREFEPYRDFARDRDIVYMGRLIHEKGCDLLLRSIAQLKSQGIVPSLSVIGDGPELRALRSLSSELGISSQVEFMGAVREGRGRIVARHRVMAIPSRWAEPFGIVALEGIASGCAVVASSLGGLRDAVGDCGLYFANGDVDGLTSALCDVLSDPASQQDLRRRGPEHLSAFQPTHVAKRYLDLFHQVLTR